MYGTAHRKLWLPGLVCALAALLVLPGAALAAPYDINVEPVSHLGGCVYKNEFQRGDQAVWLVTITDHATGQTAKDISSVMVKVGDKELKANYNEKTMIWGAALPILWDMPTGTLKHSVTVTDAKGNVTEWKPAYAANQEIVISPGPIALATQMVDPVSGAAVETVQPGATVRILAKANRPLKAEQLFMGGKADREITLQDKGAPIVDKAQVKATIGQGSFIQASRKFSGGNAAEVDLKFDAAREAWTATYTFPQDAAPGSYSIAVVAEDPSGNKGTSMAGTATLALPPPPAPGPLDGTRGLYAGLAVAVVGIVLAILLAGRRGNRRMAAA